MFIFFHFETFFLLVSSTMFMCVLCSNIFSWKKKLPKSKSPLESTWLYHEIGRCHLELGEYQEAKDYGEKSVVAAKEADDPGWQLHACVLVAQSEGTYCFISFLIKFSFVHANISKYLHCEKIHWLNKAFRICAARELNWLKFSVFLWNID